MDIDIEEVVVTRKVDIKKDLKGGVTAAAYAPDWFRATEHTPVIGEFVWIYNAPAKLLAAVEWDEDLNSSDDFIGVYWHPVDAPQLPEFDELDSE